MVLPDYAELPEDFEYTDAGTIDPDELAALMQTVDIGSDMTTRELIEAHKDFEEDGYGSVEIGVRNKQGSTLVGYGGLIYDSNGDAEMGDFVVNPTYQGRGIGKAIIDQRLLLADRLGIRRILIPNFESTNTLKHHYEKRGFVEQEDGTLVRTPLEFASMADELSLAK